MVMVAVFYALDCGAKTEEIEIVWVVDNWDIRVLLTPRKICQERK